MIAAELREARFDPVEHGQRLFRRLLGATARPGSLHPVDDIPLEVPPVSLLGACATLLVLLDPEVAVHVADPQAPRVAECLAVNTGARLAPLESADFVLFSGGGSAGQVGRVRRGSLQAPHESATVLFAPAGLSDGPLPAAVRLRLTDPGVAGTRDL